MLRIFILADDLSGAADSGVACVTAGLRTSVALEAVSDCGDAEAFSLDADTRCMPAEVAADEVVRQICRYVTNPDLLIFKKIDSTLRGNLAQELAAALNGYRSVHGERAIAVVAPAFPAIGRTTVGGVQLVHGQPLHELDVWRIQRMTGFASIPEMLKSAGLRFALLRLENVRAGAGILAEEMELLSRQTDVLVCDAETDADLRAIAGASMNLSQKPLWVGSAGLAYQLPVVAGLAPTAQTTPATVPQCTGTMLFVIGSLSRASIEQVRALSSCGQATAIQLRPDVLLVGEESAEWREYARQLASSLKANRDVVMSVETEPQLELACRSQLASALGRMTRLVSGEVGALVASGGETARAVLRSWGITRLRLLGEVERGIPVSIADGWSREMPVITKAGDFGQADTLLKCERFLRGGRAALLSEHVERKVSR